MHELYMDAEDVLAWIGPERPTCFYRNPFGVAMPWLNPSYLKDLLLMATPRICERRFLEGVRNSDYWTRAWIDQEQVLARKVTVLLGNSYMSKKRLVKVHEMSWFEFFFTDFGTKAVQ